MVGGVGDFNDMAGFFPGMVGTGMFSSSPSSSCFSISSLVLPRVMIFGSLFLVTILEECTIFSE